MPQNPNILSLLTTRVVWKTAGVILVLFLGLYLYLGRKMAPVNGTSFAARRGPLVINVLEGGSLEALESQEIRSQVKGYQGTKILSIVEEGYLVTDDDIKNGKVLVELDSSELRDKITTQEIQFQSTLATLIDAKQAYDIQMNQNLSDIKAAEQKVRFAKMDLEKFLGDTNTQDIIARLGLYEKPFTNQNDLAEIEAEFQKAMESANRAPSGALALTNPANLAQLDGPNFRLPVGSDENRPNLNRPGGSDTSGSRPPRPGGPGGPRSDSFRPSGAGANPNFERAGDPTARSGSNPTRSGADQADAAQRERRGPRPGGPRPEGFRPGAPRDLQSLTNLAGGPNLPRPAFATSNSPARFPSGPNSDLPKLIPPGPNPNPLSIGTDPLSVAAMETPFPSILTVTNSPIIEFGQYANNRESLGDGAAKQQLRKLDDDLMLSEQELSQAKIKLAGTDRLFLSNFVTQTELDSDKLSVKRGEVKRQAAQTALDLYVKYEFTKSAEEFVSKYDEALRSIERARKEAISKEAQARARLKSAQGRFRIETEQRQELVDQMHKCVIRAERPGLVVYGGGRERGFFGEEQIREGAVVRERQPIMSIPDMTTMAVQLKIHESHIKKVAKGLKARITVDAFPNEVLTGEVVKVGVLPDSQNRWMNPDMKVYVTSVAVNGVFEWLKPGMSAKVEIKVKELPDVVYIPLQSVATIKAKQVCFVANGGKPDQREIDVGEFNDEFIEVKKGLKEGEKVLLRPPEGVETDTTSPGEQPPEPAAAPTTPESRQPRPAQPQPSGPMGPRQGRRGDT